MNANRKIVIVLLVMMIVAAIAGTVYQQGKSDSQSVQLMSDYSIVMIAGCVPLKILDISNNIVHLMGLFYVLA